MRFFSASVLVAICLVYCQLVPQLLYVSCRSTDGARHKTQQQRTKGSILRKAVESAQQRISAGDSVCHGGGVAINTDLSADIYMSFVKRRAMEQEENPEYAIKEKYTWCKADAQCCKEFQLESCADNGDKNDEYTDFQMFRYIMSQTHDESYPLTKILDESGLCGASSALDGRSELAISHAAVNASGEHVLDKILRQAHVLEMRLQRYSRGQVHCAENQKFKFSMADAEGRCVCAEADDDCHAAYRKSHISPWTWSTTALVVGAIALVILSALEIYHLIYQITIFHAMRYSLYYMQNRLSSGTVTAAEKEKTEKALDKDARTFMSILGSEHKAHKV